MVGGGTAAKNKNRVFGGEPPDLISVGVQILGGGPPDAVPDGERGRNPLGGEEI